MDQRECYRRITFSELLVAFMELAFAYCLLCISTFIFLTSKLLVYLPCPCSGVLGYRNRDLCIHKLFFDWPFEIILKVQKLATTRTRVCYHQEQEQEGEIKDKKNLELMNKVRLLEEAVEEERVARAALMVELEEERAASASAADEAMAMILRLQADKASLEMEGKQYERMIEEKFAYDEEEMNILKEILFKREKEKHFLEKELETYKHVDDDDDSKAEDREPVVYDVHVIEDNNDVRLNDYDDDATEKKEKDDDQVKQMDDDMVKDHDPSSSPSSSSSLYLS